MTHYLVTAIIDFIVSLIALSKKDKPAAKALAFASFSLGLWSLELFLLTVVKDLDLLSILFHVTRWGMFFIPPSLALLAWMLMGARSRIFFILVVAPGFAISFILSVVNAFVFPSVLEVAQGGFLPKVDAIYYTFSANFVWCLFGAIILALALYRSSTYREKQRVKWLLIILLMTLCTGIASLFLIKHDFYLRLIGASTNITFVTLLLYATVQHHLMDLRLAFSVGLARAVLIAAVFWFYFFISSVAGDLVNSTAGILVNLIFIVVVLEAYPRVLRWLLPGAKKIIASHRYEFESVTDEARRALNSCIDVSGLIRVTDTLFKHVTRVESYQIFIFDDKKLCCVNTKVSGDLLVDAAGLVEFCKSNPGLIIVDETPEDVQALMANYDANACFSFRFEGSMLGVVLIGRSLDQAYYQYDDIRVFEWLHVELGEVVSRIDQLDEMQNQLGQAKKTLSMLSVMNHYHHDIKAPLAIIDGVLSNDIYDKEKQKDIVLEQVARGSQLIATMAGILKGERKRKVLPVSLGEMVKHSLYLFSQRIDEVNYLYKDIPKIMGDADDIKILVINIIKNAIEARQEGQPLVITISTWQSDSHVCLSFADSGVGMPQSIVDSLWDGVVSTKVQGNGIGMQAIKRIADEHFAEIDVKSEMGKGCEFIVKFPNSIIAEEEDEKPVVSGDNVFPHVRRGD